MITAQIMISITQNMGRAVYPAMPSPGLRTGEERGEAGCSYVFCSAIGPTAKTVVLVDVPQLKTVWQFGHVG